MRATTIAVRSVDHDEVASAVAEALAAIPHAAITIFNIGPAVQALQTAVQALTILVQQVLANQQQQAQATALVAKSIAGVAAQLGAFAADQVPAIIGNTAKNLDLLQALVAALGTLATEENQERIIAMIETLTSLLDPNYPISVGIDPTVTASRPQAEPTKEGP